MNPIYLLAVILGFLLAYLYYRRDEDTAERRYKQGITLWRLSFIPVYTILALSLIYRGGIVSFGALFIITILFGLYVLVFRPHEKVNQMRQKA